MRRPLLSLCLAVAVIISSGAITAMAGRLLFKGKVKIPYALQVGSRRAAPGEYMLRITIDKGMPVLTLRSKKTGLLRLNGENGRLPDAEKKTVKGQRLRIFPVPDPKNEGKRLIVFQFDARGPVGDFYRKTFKCREAEKEESD